jgi:hypothetical protein
MFVCTKPQSDGVNAFNGTTLSLIPEGIPDPVYLNHADD